MTSLQNLTLDKAELEQLLQQATRPTVKALLQQEIKRVDSQLKLCQEQNTSDDLVLPSQNGTSTSDNTVTEAVVSKPIDSTLVPFMPITQYELKKGSGYGDTQVVIDFRLKCIESVPKENISCKFSEPCSIDLKVIGVPSESDGKSSGKNYRFNHTALQHDILSDKCSYQIKKNHIIITLCKQSSNDMWTEIGGRKRSKDKKNSNTGTGSGKSESGGLPGAGAVDKSNPMSGIMDLMKDMYEDGDDATRKMIGECMEKSMKGKGGGGMDSDMGAGKGMGMGMDDLDM